MATLNLRNDLTSAVQQPGTADQRVARLVALGADLGMARQVAAMELGLLGSDRSELADQAEERSPLFATADLGVIDWNRPEAFIQSAMEETPSILPSMSPIRGKDAAGRGKMTHDPLL